MQLERAITAIEPHVFFTVFGVSVADSTMLILVLTFVLLLIGFFFIRRFSLVPSRMQTAVEAVYESAYDLIGNIIQDDSRTRKAFPIIGAMLFYLIAANLIGLIPGVGQVTFGGHDVFRTPTSDFNTTFGLALAAVVIINIISIREKGMLNYLDQFLRFRSLWRGFRKGFGQGMLAIIDFFIGLLDIIGEVVKVVSLSLRLFGNMYAGQILAIILLGFLAVIVPSLWLAMNLFVGVLQGIVFAALIASYYMLAVNEADVRDDTQQ